MKTNYPIVLVHGMMAKDFPFWHAFRGISGFLQEQNVTDRTNFDDAFTRNWVRGTLLPLLLMHNTLLLVLLYKYKYIYIYNLNFWKR